MGGGELPIEKLRVLPDFDRSKIISSVRYWDKGGGTEEDASFTAGVLMHKLSDGTFVIEHIMRGRWSTLEREQRIKRVTDTDQSRYPNYCVWIEQEPGSGGKESAENTLRNLSGWRCYADKVTGSKQTRVQPFAAQVQAGNVWLIVGQWVPPFLDECEQWPFGKYNDQVDACAGAFNKLTKSQYDTSYSWV